MLHGWIEDSMLVKRITAYPSIFNRLRAIARYLSELQLFLPLAFNAPFVVFPLEFRKKVWSSEN